MGIQLRPYNTGNIFDFLNFIQNLSIILFMAYTCLVNDLYEVDKPSKFFLQSKPLFGLLFWLSARIMFPIGDLITNLYYIKYGFHIIQLLDSKLSNSTFRKGSSRFIWAILLFNISIFFLFNYERVIPFFYSYDIQQKIRFLIRFYCLFILDSTRNFVLVIIHYLQNSTLKNLEEVYRRLKTNDQKFGLYMVTVYPLFYNNNLDLFIYRKRMY